ncbi:IclR family transcriptional regulator [Peterkaempfera bronchialis]|uniref:IclR family transcriptional regulator n=1 Tax=Peterkaempfera bronchialis TaxID=2126346 RepID=A0A345T4L4_9ACTN|nr:IclR family transcriptional regulator [Peterkaempfera bronchialis]AXI80919.1 IclR family transcriptional regulator [Peterkaempfera bronchialis]
MSPELSPTPGLRNNSASLRRALSILLQLGEATDGTGYSVAELCAELDMNKSTLLRLVQPLLEARFIEQLPNGRYRLGWRNAQLGNVYLAGLDLPRSMHDVLQKLASQTRETVHLVVADYPNIVYIDKVDTAHPVRMFSRIGHSAPAYCTSVGKAMLAHATAETVDLVIENGMPARTPRTITTAEGLRAALSRIRKQGYAVDDVEHEEGIRCVAAPVFDQSGACSSAISVSAPAERIPSEKVPELAPLVIAAAHEISTRLGAIR